MDALEDSHNAPVYLVTDIEHDHMTDSDTFTSETSSCQTMSTLGSEEVAAYFQSLHGFQYTADENIPNFLPSDSTSVRVNVLLNAILKIFQGGKSVPAAADEFLQRGGLVGEGARVLDLVTASGVWAHEMAGAYPTAEIVSLDVRPLTAFAPHPRITFEVYDLYAGIAEPDASFDLVHARRCITLTKDYNFLLREMHRVLKPDGMLVIGELLFQAFEVDNPSVVFHSSPCRVEAMQLMQAAQRSQGIDLTAFEDLPSRLDPGYPMWGNHCPDDPAKLTSPAIRGFHTITSHTYLIPSGPWSADEQERVIGGLARVMFEYGWKALLPIMQVMGYSKADAEAFVDALLDEVKDPRYRSYAKFKVWCARKI